MPQSWFIRHRTLVHYSIPVLFGLLSILIAILVYVLEHNVENRALIFIVALIVPSAISLVFISEIALAWFYNNYLIESGKTVGAEVKTFHDAREFARFRRDLVQSIKPGSIEDPIFSTSHCNLFARPEGRDAQIKDEVKELNREFFEHLAMIALQANRGGLRLLMQYDDNEEEELERELRNRLEIFSRKAVETQRPWNRLHFDVRRLVQKSVKDYLVIEDHVFKTIRKTEESNSETQYIYIRSPEIGATYRGWLADLFEYGDGAMNRAIYTERNEIRAVFDRLKGEVEKAQTEA